MLGDWERITEQTAISTLKLNHERSLVKLRGDTKKQSNSNITQSLNKAILFMLFVVFFVLSCIVYSIFTLISRSNNIQT